MKLPIHIGIVVGESSGDYLGSVLIAELRKHFPQARFSGMGGELMRQQGFELLYDCQSIAVMGFIEPLKRIMSILRIRRGLQRHFQQTKPQVFIGIDAPDFNIGLELKLRRRGIKVVHYISPQIWAWRKWRIHKIAKAVDLMLTHFDFETEIYRQHGVPVACIGHPLLDEIPLDNDKIKARKRLNIEEKIALVAILAGSRQQEIEVMLPIYLQTAQVLQRQSADKRIHVEFIIPAVDAQRQRQIESIIATAECARGLVIHYAVGQARLAMEAADVGIVTSGTVTLEAILLKLPIVVAYIARPSWLYPIMKYLVKVKFISLPNLMANKSLVPEFIQERVNPEVMSQQLLDWLQSPTKRQVLQYDFRQLHERLRMSTKEKLANKVVEVINLTNV